MTESREVLLTRGQAAKVANVHPSTISKWKKRKQIRTTHDGKYALSDVQRVASAANEIAVDIMPVLTQPPTALQNDRRDDEMRRLTIERDALLEERNALRRELELAREQERVWLKQALEAAQERERLLLQLLGKEQEPATPIHPIPSETAGEDLTQQTAAPIADQVQAYLKTHPGSHRVKAIQEALGLPKSPKDALGRLARRGAVQRTAIGEYEAKPYEPGPETFLGQILEHVRKVTAEGRTIRAWQIQRDLKLDQPPHRELSKLFKAELVYRIPPAPGVYSAKPPANHTGTPTKTLEPTGETNASEESGE